MQFGSWVLKSDPDKQHVGPAPEDFHAAFGLDGSDDKHMNLSDVLGVSIAAIQELHDHAKQQDAAVAARLADKDAQIAAIKGQLQSMRDAFAARLDILERQHAPTTLAQTASLTH